MTFKEWRDANEFGDCSPRAAWDAAMEQREAEIAKIRAVIVKTLEDNLDLTDGDNCTLYDLKKLVGWD